jgi:tRNA A-37 threonylcarbamoyl transferase component Bud32
MYIIAASLLGNFALNIYVYFWGPEPPFSRFNFKREALVVEEVLPNSAADRASIQAGDRVLAIDGRRVRGLGQWDMIRINFEVGKAYRLQVERDGKPFERVMKLQRRSWSQQTQYRRIAFVLYTASALLTLFVAFLIAFTRPYDWVARIGALSIALLGGFLGGSASLYGVSAICRRLPTLVGALIWWPTVGFFIFPALFFTFSSIFPRKLFRSRWIWMAIVPSTVFLLPMAGFTYYTFVNPLGEATTPDWVPRLGESLLFAYLGAGLLALILNYRRLDDVNQKRRIRVLVAGSLLGYLVLVPYVVMSVMRASGQSGIGRVLFSWPALLLVTVLYQAFPVSWAYAILRHRLFDVRVILRRGLQYALARRLLVSAVPVLAAILLLDLLLHGDQPILAVFRARGWVYAALAVGAAIAYKQRQRWLEALDRRFFRDRYDARRLLREVVEELRVAQSFEQVAPRVVARVEAALHPEFVALVIREPREPSYRSLAAAPAGQAPPLLPAQSKLMALVRLLGKPLEVPQTETGWLKEQLPHEETEFLRQARIELLVPIATAPERTEALLALGAKRSEEPYSGEDQDLLVAIATSLAILLEKPPAVVAPRRDVFEECPECGTCYDTGITRCAHDSAALVPVTLPRVLEGRYRVDRRLGRGGMGTVYEAADTALERRVAVKVIRDDLVGSAEAAERFRREARAAAAFAHPNVVTVHDFGVAMGTRAFLVMELLHGTTLRERLRRDRQLTPASALAILRGVCSAVEAAHRRQLIHRDLKPENIFLVHGEPGEIAKVLDFGIAKFLPTATHQPTVDTGTGALVGTLRYMSPEQWRGEEAHPGWDLWSLAVVAYEALTGAHPFDGTPSAEWSRAVLAGRFTPVAAYLPEAPLRWQEFFERTFAPEPARRPVSAEMFLAEFQSALA